MELSDKYIGCKVITTGVMDGLQPEAIGIIRGQNGYRYEVEVLSGKHYDGREMKDTNYLHTCNGKVPNKCGYIIKSCYLELLSSSQNILILLL